MSPSRQIDPRRLAEEIRVTADDFNRLAALAAGMGCEVQAEVVQHFEPDGPARAVVTVNVVLKP